MGTSLPAVVGRRFRAAHELDADEGVAILQALVTRSRVEFLGG